MARYLEPSRLVRRVMNPLVMRLGAASTLEVPTRVSGRQQHVPVNLLEHDGARYLVSARGDTQWVRNVRAAGRCDVRRRGRGRSYTVTEVPVEDRAPIIAAYLAKWGSQVGRFFKEMPDAADHPVFELRDTP